MRSLFHAHLSSVKISCTYAGHAAVHVAHSKLTNNPITRLDLNEESKFDCYQMGNLDLATVDFPYMKKKEESQAGEKIKSRGVG